MLNSSLARSPISRSVARISVIVAAIAVVVAFVSTAPSQGAADSTSATYYKSLTIFTTVRHHNSGGMSWENQGGNTTWDNGRVNKEWCGGRGDAVALRYPGGSQFAVAYFSPTTYSWQGFPQSSYGPRRFVMSFKMEHYCTAPHWEESRSIWGRIHY